VPRVGTSPDFSLPLSDLPTASQANPNLLGYLGTYFVLVEISSYLDYQLIVARARNYSISRHPQILTMRSSVLALALSAFSFASAQMKNFTIDVSSVPASKKGKQSSSHTAQQCLY
jgi:hypothetical protein